MGTLQQELTKVQTLSNLTFDDEPGAQAPVVEVAPIQTKMSKAHIIWQFISENPSCTVADIADSLGYVRADASSYASQLLERGLVSRTKHNGFFCYVTAVDSFPVYTNEMRAKNLAKGWEARRSMKHKPKRVLVKRKTVESAPPRPLAEVKHQILTGVTNEFNYSVNTFISQLNVHQAKAVYEELKKLFGG